MHIKKYLAPPYVLLALLSLIMLVSSFFIRSNVTLINHDTYFIINNTIAHAILAIILLGAWLVYILADKILPSRIFTIIHIYSLVLFTGIWLMGDWLGWPNHRPRNEPITYYSESKLNLSGAEICLILVSAIFLIGCGAIVVNFAIGIMKMIKSKRTKDNSKNLQA